MPLINCEIDLQLKWSKKRILEAGTAVNEVQDFKTTNPNFMYQLQLYQLTIM